MGTSRYLELATIHFVDMAGQIERRGNQEVPTPGSTCSAVRTDNKNPDFISHHSPEDAENGIKSVAVTGTSFVCVPIGLHGGRMCAALGLVIKAFVSSRWETGNPTWTTTVAHIAGRRDEPRMNLKHW